jgi:hypothetical protein
VIDRYPIVMNEFDTMRAVLSGKSLARYGDGELKMAHHLAGIKSQAENELLTARLADILHRSGECLVGIPNIHAVIDAHVSDQKVEHWARYLSMKSVLADRRYVSSFVTRPDSAPWINTPEYWAMVESLWIGQDVTLVRGSGKSLVADDLQGARTITEILAPRQHAWAEYDQLLERIGTPKRALLCLGPTATVMAVDLCKKGVHAIDLGHVGLFLHKVRRGEPMWLTKEDKTPEVVAS